MNITQFPSDKNTQGRRICISWEGLVDALATRRAASDVPKEELPMWSPAVFRGDERKASNVEEVSCMVFDVDEKPVPTADELRRALAWAGQWFAHSSSTSTAEAPRWRLLVALNRPVSAAEHGVLWRLMTERLGFPVGAASKDCSRGWYCPQESRDGSFAVITENL